jgi:hypothetical protein
VLADPSVPGRLTRDPVSYAQRTVEQFAQGLRDEVDLDALTDDLGDDATTALHPAHTSVWLAATAARRSDYERGTNHPTDGDAPRVSLVDEPYGRQIGREFMNSFEPMNCLVADALGSPEQRYHMAQ